MKRVLEEGEAAEGEGTGNVEEVMVDTVVRGFVSDWDAMEDLLHHVLYINIGWEIGDEGQILFTEPLFTPKAHYYPPPPQFQVLLVCEHSGSYHFGLLHQF